MSTRGLYGFRKNGADKTTYNHFDSYPEGLGREIVKFIIGTTPEEMSLIFDKIKLVDKNREPTFDQIAFCIDNGLFDKNVSTGTDKDWYCLLRNMQGDLGKLKNLIRQNSMAYMIDDSSFIEDSLFCEHAYIINLDTGKLEYWIGFQNKPCDGNRYGQKEHSRYYPCKMICEIPFSEITDEESAVDRMISSQSCTDENAATEEENDYMCGVTG